MYECVCGGAGLCGDDLEDKTSQKKKKKKQD